MIGNRVGGNVQTNQNRGGVDIVGNTIDGNLQCQANDPAPTGGSNTVRGPSKGQCASLGPAVKMLERDPHVALRSFDEEADPEAWEALAVPGAPYAVALSLDGAVLAKGTFNTLPQLESVLGEAERRALEPAGG